MILRSLFVKCVANTLLQKDFENNQKGGSERRFFFANRINDVQCAETLMSFHDTKLLSLLVKFFSLSGLVIGRQKKCNGATG